MKSPPLITPEDARDLDHAIASEIAMDVDKEICKTRIQTPARESNSPCPECYSGNAGCIDSRPTTKGIRRRRRCYNCHHRWTTIEIDASLYDDLLKRLAALRRVKRNLDIVFQDTES